MRQRITPRHVTLTEVINRPSLVGIPFWYHKGLRDAVLYSSSVCMHHLVEPYPYLGLAE